MSWHYSQALEEAFLEACSSDGAPSALWRSTPSALDDSCSDKMKDTCHRSPFGMMFVPSTDSRGEGLLTWFLEASRVRTSAWPEKAQESTESEAGSGVKWPASFARYNRDTRSWKTAQLSLFEDLGESSVIWPRWGWMHDGACWERTTSALPTSARGSGFWPTPDATHAERAMERRKGITKFPTPCTPNGGRRNKPGDIESKGSRPDGTKVQVSLESVIGGPQNPTWTEWLMGWPLGWTACEPLVTDRFQRWFDWHGRRLDHGHRDHK